MTGQSSFEIKVYALFSNTALSDNFYSELIDKMYEQVVWMYMFLTNWFHVYSCSISVYTFCIQMSYIDNCNITV